MCSRFFPFQIDNMLHIVKKFLSRVLHLFLFSIKELIAPPFCAYCRTFLHNRIILCATCRTRSHPIASYDLIVTRSYAVRVFAISNYKDPIRALILAKGYGNLAASRQLGILLWQMTDIKYQDFDYIVPVPLHWVRYAQRGYNQATEMALGLQSMKNVPVLQALGRKKSTVYQSTLTAAEREQNVRDAFFVYQRMHQKLHGAHILLIDDLMTTGATLRACVHALREVGPANIIVAVASRVM
jgi:ComF family protein